MSPELGPIATEIHVPWNVGGQGKSGLVVLNVSFVARDPGRTQDEVHSFDQLVRADEQRGWHLDAERLRSFHIYDQFEARWLVDW